MITALDRFFQSAAWKIVAFLSLGLLLVFLARAIVSLEASFDILQTIAAKRGFELEDVKLAVWEGKFAVIALVFVALAGLVDLTTFITRSREYRSATSVIRRFQSGELALRAPRYENREVDELGKAFNKMAETIVQNMESLKEMDLLRRELIGNVAHDLGTPLTSIKGFVETIFLKQKDLSPDELKRILTIIMKNTDSIGGMVNELSELSLLDSASASPTFQLFSISTLSKDVASRFAPIAQEKDILLEVEERSTLPLVMGDVSLIERVLTNIIQNSIKYTQPKGKINITFAVSSTNVTVSIHDSGIGIPKDALPRIFERFFRVGSDRSRRSGGSGLGLAIVKKILDLHGSTVSVQSSEGKGTKIEFSLPFKR